MLAAGRPHSTSRVPPTTPPSTPPPSAPWPCSYSALTTCTKFMPARLTRENTTAVPHTNIIRHRALAHLDQMGSPSATSTATYSTSSPSTYIPRPNTPNSAARIHAQTDSPSTKIMATRTAPSPKSRMLQLWAMSGWGLRLRLPELVFRVEVFFVAIVFLYPLSPCVCIVRHGASALAARNA